MGSTIKIIKTVLSLPFILVVAWVLTHVMAVLGVFAVSAYPIWVVFFPSNSMCFGCRSIQVGDECPLCHEKVEKGNFKPKNARSIFLNTFVILLLTIFSIGVVYFESLIIDKSGLTKALKTVSFVIPDKSQYRTNEIFPMKIEINGIKTPINVVQADITFDPDILEVIDVSTKESFATIFVQKDVNNNLGYLRITGGVPNPGYSNDGGVFGTVYFKTKSAGLVTVSFLPTSLVLANDGRGTNVLKEYPSTSYVVRPEKISTEEELSQSEIYKSSVLGVSTPSDPNECTISFVTGNVPNVLGASSDPNDILVGETDNPTTPEKEENFSFFDKLLSLLHTFDQWIISIYTKVFSSIFTN